MTESQPSTSGDLLPLLQQCLFLESLAPEHLRTLAEMASRVEVVAGERIFREGDSADDAFLIVSGRVVLEICAPGVGCKQICTLTDGELLGWSPLLEQIKFTATARALEPTTLIRLDAERLRQQCQEDVALGYEILRRTGNSLAKRLSATRLPLIDVYGSQMPEAEANQAPLDNQRGAE
jgi:CRP/FNR family transcriptional regulator, cyclic AMP receptor protein